MSFHLLYQLKPWLSWLHLHPQWVALATLFIAFIECLAVVGLLIPGTVIMTAIGALIGSDVVAAETVFVPAIIGAILGDAISFGIGYYYQEHLREIWPFKFYPRLLQKGENFFYRHGGKGIFFGRFIGPIRPLLPIIAGMLNMPPWRFFLADIISGIFWAPLYMLPGILLGAASVELAPNIAMHLMLYVIFILLILWCISWLIKRFIAWIFATLHQFLDDILAVIKHHRWLRPLSITLQDPLHPDSHAQLTLALYFIFIGSCFVWVTFNVMQHGYLIKWNEPLLYLFRSVRTTMGDHLMVVITLFAKPSIQLVGFFITLIWLGHQRTWRTASHWLLLGICAFCGTELLKYGVHSIRPTGLQVAPAGYSFPSGHATITTALAGWIAVLVARELKKTLRWLPYAIVTMGVLIVSFSRLYLGAHWLTDVIGGILFAITLIMIITLSYRRQLTPRLPWRELITVFLSSWLFAGSIYTIIHYHQAVENYRLHIPKKTATLVAWWKNNGIDQPLYRLNRLGKPAQIFNVQWVGNINEIEQQLIMHGWNIFPNTTFSIVLQRLNKQTTSVELPIVPQLYLNQRPALVMTKKLPTPHTLLVLTLWDSHTLFSDSDLSLWLGNINYYHISQTGLFHLHPPHINLPSEPPLEMLAIDLTNFYWKQIEYSATLPEYLEKLPWDRQLLLVQPSIEGAI